ncbi:MAG: YdjY domain-containing protein [Verrucomicrobiota bacterium]
MISIHSPAQSPTSPLKELSPGVFQIGRVRLNVKQKTVQFPASINMTNGLVEYLLVTGTGKLHESVLKTEVDPAQIHIAMLFLGARVATNAFGTNICGEKIEIAIRSIAENPEPVSAEELVFNDKTKLPMKPEGWIYNGSKVVDGTFIAQRDGSIVSIITDPLALANSRQVDRDNDEIWFVNTNTISPVNSKVEVTFKMESAKKIPHDPK